MQSIAVVLLLVASAYAGGLTGYSTGNQVTHAVGVQAHHVAPAYAVAQPALVARAAPVAYAQPAVYAQHQVLAASPVVRTIAQPAYVGHAYGSPAVATYGAYGGAALLH